ncbi:MAG: inositol monophosphatase family protein [Rhodoglobus sp.]
MPYDDLLSIARTVTTRAAALAKQRRSEGVEVAGTKSSVVDVVTEADRETEALIRALLAEARPHDGFFGEESGAEKGSSGLTWIVDPIDGTVNYLYGIPHYAVSIAVVEGDPDPASWSALVACVVNPAASETYTATVGGGAFLGGAAIRVADSVEPAQALVSTGFAYDSVRRAEQGALIARLLPLVRDIRRQGTASLDLCSVASGRCNAYFERGLSPWDHAAGVLIAREAGAQVTGRGEAPPGRDLVLAAHPDLASSIEKILGQIGL